MTSLPHDALTPDAPPPPSPRAAFVHLATVWAVLVAAAGVTYVVPGLDRAKPWVPGEPVPVLSAFGVGGDNAAADPKVAEVVQRTLEQTHPEHRPAPEHHGSPVEIDPAEYADIAVEIEGKEHLAKFFEALRKTALKKEAKITRVAHYGDSSVASDHITATMRRELQLRFGDSGHGFILVDRGTMPYAHQHIYARGDHSWDLKQVIMNEDRNGHYGYGGVQYRGAGGASATFATLNDSPVGSRMSRAELFYRALPRGGNVVLTVDRKQKSVISTKGEDADAFATVEFPDGHHRVELRLEGTAQLYGIAFERPGPGVVYDSLGLVGARARRLLNFNAEHLKGQLQHRNPDLIVLGFGGNEAEDYAQAISGHETEMREVVALMRSARADMPCLLFAPLDQAHRNSRGQIQTFKSIPKLVEAQRSAAKQSKCAFFDTFKAMGGEGTMNAWTKTRPRLASSDLRHATPEGYEVVGTLFYKAMLKAFAEYLKTHPAN
jgi:lysophospholipase L1-like esterase